MRPGKDHRRTPRVGLGSAVGISWQDGHGRFRATQARGIDISENGLQVELTEPIELRTAIHLQAEKYRLAASGAVRHCERWGPRYRVGLEFTAGFRWKPEPAPPEGPVLANHP